MSTAPETPNRPGTCDLSALFASYLRRQAHAHAEGLGYAEPTEEVVPHEAVPVQPVDPRLAWNDGLAVAAHFAAAPLASVSVPPDWPALVAAQVPALAVAFCLGNYPQLVRSVHPLLAGELPAPRVVPSRPVGVAALVEWARKPRSCPESLLAAGLLRLAGCFDEAETILRTAVPSAWQALAANEQAALAWQRGRSEEALALWSANEPSVPVLFNRGMAGLFLGRPADAQANLERAVAQLPETSSWYHLGHLYLAVAQARRG